jgi:hypothetical protein
MQRGKCTFRIWMPVKARPAWRSVSSTSGLTIHACYRRNFAASGLPGPKCFNITRFSLSLRFGDATGGGCGGMNGVLFEAPRFPFGLQFHFSTSDSQSCSTTSAELSPGVIDGITKRLPSAETSNEGTE